MGLHSGMGKGEGSIKFCGQGLGTALLRRLEACLCHRGMPVPCKVPSLLISSTELGPENGGLGWGRVP